MPTRIVYVPLVVVGTVCKSVRMPAADAVALPKSALLGSRSCSVGCSVTAVGVAAGWAGFAGVAGSLGSWGAVGCVSAPVLFCPLELSFGVIAAIK